MAISKFNKTQSQWPLSCSSCLGPQGSSILLRQFKKGHSVKVDVVQVIHTVRRVACNCGELALWCCSELSRALVYRKVLFSTIVGYHKMDCEFRPTCFTKLSLCVLCVSLRHFTKHSSSSLSSSECSAQEPVLHCKLRYQGADLPKDRSSTANSGTKVAVLLLMNRCGSFPLLSVPHSLSLFSIWIVLKRSETIPGAPAWRCGEWIWLTGLSGFHQNSPHGLNISSIRVSDQIRDPEIPITLRPLASIIKPQWFKS